MKKIPHHITHLLNDFVEISDIKEKFEFLIELAEELENFPESEKTEEHKIFGCASNMWITVKNSPEKNIVKISGTGDAVISKGMLMFFIQCFKNLSAQEILDIKKNFPEIFLKSGVLSSLSPSRANGAKAMLEKIYEECKKLV